MCWAPGLKPRFLVDLDTREGRRLWRRGRGSKWPAAACPRPDDRCVNSVRARPLSHPSSASPSTFHQPHQQFQLRAVPLQVNRRHCSSQTSSVLRRKGGPLSTRHMSVEIQTAFTSKGARPRACLRKTSHHHFSLLRRPSLSCTPTSCHTATATDAPIRAWALAMGGVAPHFSLALSSQIEVRLRTVFSLSLSPPGPSTTTTHFHTYSIDLQVLARSCRDYSAREAPPSVATLEHPATQQPRPGQGEGTHHHNVLPARSACATDPPELPPVRTRGGSLRRSPCRNKI